MVSYIYINLAVNAIVRLPHPHNGDSQGQEMFLAPSADKQTRDHDTERSNHIKVYKRDNKTEELQYSGFYLCDVIAVPLCLI